MANKIQIRRDTTANWTASNPILSQGELGLDTTLNKIKIGNGTAQWSALSFFIGDTGATGATGPQGNVGPAGVTELSELVNGTAILSLDATGDLTLADNGGIVFDRNNTSIRVGMGFHIASGEGISLEAIDQTDPDNLITQGWYFGTDGRLTLPGNAKIANPDDTLVTTGLRINVTGSVYNASTGNIDLQLADPAIGALISANPSFYSFRFASGAALGITLPGAFVAIGTPAPGSTWRSQGWGLNTPNISSAFSLFSSDYVDPYTAPGYLRLSSDTGVDWTFGKDGKLQLPEGGDIVNEFGTSVLSSTDVYRFASGVIGTRGELTTLGNSMLGGFPIILDPAGESDAGLYIPSVSQQVSGTALQIKNKGAASSIVQVIGWGGVQLVTNTGLDEKVFEFGDDGKLTLPKGSVVSETSNTVAIAPPTAAAGQSLVIRPTTVAWGLAASSYIVYGSPITVSVTTIGGSSYFGTVNYTFSGCTAEQLGRALTGQITFPGGNTGNPQTITWTIPANSNITTFTLTLGSAVGVFGTDFNFELNGLPDGQFLTVTNNGITNSEFSHVHLVAGDPTTVDIYLGDDDQYVKIEKNAGDVVIGTNLDTHQWTFGTDGKLTLPADSLIESETASTISVGAGLAELETTYTELMLMLDDIFTQISSESGYPWGITLPLSVPLTYNQLINLPPNTFTSQATATTVAHNANTAYNVWQDAADVTNIHINVSDKSWVFGNDSKLTLPGGNAQIVAESNGGVRIGTANTNVAQNAQIRIGGADHVFEIFGGPPAYSWKFEADGKLKLPGTSYASTSQNYIHAEYGIGLHPTHNTGGTGPELYISYNDGILIQPFTNDYFRAGGTTASPLFINGSDLPNNDDSIGKIPGDVYIESGTNYQDSTHGKVVVKSGTNQWKFNSNGTLTLPTGSVPAHSYGAVGDTAGMLAVDATYIYYCTANFDVATPAADIWKRTAHGTGTW